MSLVVSLSCVTIFLRYSDDIYLANSKLQVKDSNSSSANLIQYSKPVLDFGNVKLENYISQIVSRSNLSSVADILDLQTSIFVIGRVKNNLILIIQSRRSRSNIISSIIHTNFLPHPPSKIINEEMKI